MEMKDPSDEELDKAIEQGKAIANAAPKGEAPSMEALQAENVAMKGVIGVIIGGIIGGRIARR